MCVLVCVKDKQLYTWHRGHQMSRSPLGQRSRCCVLLSSFLFPSISFSLYLTLFLMSSSSICHSLSFLTLSLSVSFLLCVLCGSERALSAWQKLMLHHYSPATYWGSLPAADRAVLCLQTPSVSERSCPLNDIAYSL